MQTKKELLKAIETGTISVLDILASHNIWEEKGIIEKSLPKESATINDKEVALAIMEQSPWVIAHLSSRLKNDLEVVNTLLNSSLIDKEDKRNLIGYIGAHLMSDKNFVINFLEKNDTDILAANFLNIYVDKSLYDDIDVMKKAMEKDESAGFYIGKKISKDRDFALYLLEKNGENYHYLSQGLRSSKTMIRKALANNGLSIMSSIVDLKKVCQDKDNLIIDIIMKNYNADRMKDFFIDCTVNCTIKENMEYFKYNPILKEIIDNKLDSSEFDINLNDKDVFKNGNEYNIFNKIALYIKEWEIKEYMQKRKVNIVEPSKEKNKIKKF